MDRLGLVQESPGCPPGGGHWGMASSAWGRRRRELL